MNQYVVAAGIPVLQDIPFIGKWLFSDGKDSDAHVDSDQIKPCEQAEGDSDRENLQSAPSTSTQSSEYRIIAFNRESGTEFAYRFILELIDENKRSLQTLRRVQQEFRHAVKEDYVESVPSVAAKELYVDFPEYELKDGRIEGRAVVLTISVTSLSHDPKTRTGRLAVKVNANQYEEARKWIRKNIETLARDKNIALTTGEIPPAAKFYLGKEELKDGNVLEIEFKTE